MSQEQSEFFDQSSIESVWDQDQDLDFSLVGEIFKEVFNHLNLFYTGLGMSVRLTTIDHAVFLTNPVGLSGTVREQTVLVHIYGELVGKLVIGYGPAQEKNAETAVQFGEMAADLIREKYYGRQGFRQQNQFEREIDWIFNSSNNLICSIGLDGHFKRIGKLWFYHFGHSEEELFNNPFFNFLAPEDQAATREAIENIILKGETGHFQNRYRTKWGTVRWLSWSVLPLPSQESLFCLINDITESKEFQRLVQDNERHFRATFSQAAIGITHIDIEGNWVKVNQKFCQIVGYTEQELVQMNFQDLTHPDDVLASTDFFNRILLGDKENPSIEKRYLHKNGTVIWANVTISMVQQSSEDPEYYIAFIQDITEKRETEEQLRTQTQLVSNMNVKLLKDLEYAKEIQLAFNTSYLNNQAIFCKGRYIPYERIGGDFLGIFEIDEGHTAFYIGDVAGHGVAASFTSIFIHQFINENRNPENIKLLLSPKEVLHQLYGSYNQTLFPEDIYFVMLYGVYHHETQELVYSSGGLNTLPLLLSPQGKATLLEGRNPFPIGKFSDIYQPSFDNCSVTVEPGSRLFVYTDGLIENEIQPPVQADQILRAEADSGIDKINDDLLTLIIQNSPHIFDDVAYLLMEFKASQEGWPLRGRRI